MDKFYYLEGKQISEACAKRWVDAGWIALCEQVSVDLTEDGATDWLECHYMVTFEGRETDHRVTTGA
jgi:hypothetical protein